MSNATQTESAGITAEIAAKGNVPLVDLGSLMLYATRHTAVMPNVATVRVFKGALTTDELQREAKRIASNPLGLGRKLEMPRVPGARPLWRANPTPPEVKINPAVSDPAAVSNYLDDEMSIRLDPLKGRGWRLAAAPLGEDTLVTLGINHLYGSGRDIVLSVWGDDAMEVDADGLTRYAGVLPAEMNHNLRAQALDLGSRVKAGLGGIARMGAQAFTSPGDRDPGSDAATARRPLDALLDKDRSRGKPSERRIVALARVDLEDWRAAARERGGNLLSLQVAVTANLLREARRARGGPTHRPLRILIPVDLADREDSHDPASGLGPVDLTSAGVTLPGGSAQHHDLLLVREECDRAIEEARAEVEATGRVPVAPGMVDAMRLLPDALTTRAVIHVHSRFDGAASNLGIQHPNAAVIGDHTAYESYMFAFPLGSDLVLTMTSVAGELAIGVVADPSRLGEGAPLRERLHNELTAWGLKAAVR
ncbi:MAG: hypothetical protein QM648_00235 [Solirubrobacterales bacterium]